MEREVCVYVCGGGVGGGGYFKANAWRGVSDKPVYV